MYFLPSPLSDLFWAVETDTFANLDFPSVNENSTTPERPSTSRHTAFKVFTVKTNINAKWLLLLIVIILE